MAHRAQNPVAGVELRVHVAITLPSFVSRL
jgi:hypothetical protein